MSQHGSLLQGLIAVLSVRKYRYIRVRACYHRGLIPMWGKKGDIYIGKPSKYTLHVLLNLCEPDRTKTLNNFFVLHVYRLPVKSSF